MYVLPLCSVLESEYLQYTSIYCPLMEVIHARFEQKPFSTWEEGKSFLHGLGHRYIYRGHGDSTWKLETSIERGCTQVSPAQIESAMISAFKGAAHLYEDALPSTNDDLSWLAVMQHHGVPTRLMDWTRSPYVAAYFAAEHSPREPCSFTVWAIDVVWLKWTAIQKLKRLADFEDLPSDTILGDPQHFPRCFMRNEITFIAPVQPMRANVRQTNQKGLFLCLGNVSKPFLSNLLSMREVHQQANWGYEVVFPDEQRTDTLYDLNRLNVNRSTLFPGLDGFSQALNLQLRLLQERFGHHQWRLEVEPLLREFGFL
jgi:hypothetical protein